MPSSCCEKTPEKTPEKPSDDSCCKKPSDSRSLSRLQSALGTLSPVLPALLHSSCCWLPALLDFLSIGSASAGFSARFRSVFLLVTLLILGWSVYRDGFTKRNIQRIALSFILLSWPQINQLRKAPETAQKHIRVIPRHVVSVCSITECHQISTFCLILSCSEQPHFLPHFFPSEALFQESPSFGRTVFDPVLKEYKEIRIETTYNSPLHIFGILEVTTVELPRYGNQHDYGDCNGLRPEYLNAAGNDSASDGARPTYLENRGENGSWDELCLDAWNGNGAEPG
ncbi:hypothetical protein FQN57_001716 [Myotisia sp. PD_48]|nr:hypothetical protein FQN57_001716 [Myotisia sp. PD_48]